MLITQDALSNLAAANRFTLLTYRWHLSYLLAHKNSRGLRAHIAEVGSPEQIWKEGASAHPYH